MSGISWAICNSAARSRQITDKRAATSFDARWTEAQWVWTVCPRLLPTASRLRFEPGPFCAWVQHANHSATEPPTFVRASNLQRYRAVSGRCEVRQQSYWWAGAVVHAAAAAGPVTVHPWHTTITTSVDGRLRPPLTHSLTPVMPTATEWFGDYTVSTNPA